jgi:hypothetical protein
MPVNIPDWVRQFFTKITSRKRRFDPNAQLPSFENITRDAEVLLSYAATAGITLPESDLKILTVPHNHSQIEVVSAYGRVADRLQPVTAFTLRRFFSNYRQTLRFYVICGVVFAFIVVFFSLLTFISSSLSDSLKTEIDLANSKAVTLQTHLEIPQDITPPPIIRKPFTPTPVYSLQDFLTDLQQFAISVRFIDSRAVELNHLVFFLGVEDPFKYQRNDPLWHGQFELDPKVNPTDNFVLILTTYQQVRAYAQNLRDGVTFWYGGVTASILPVLYAIFGVCALSLRRMQVAIRDKTFADFGSKEHVLVAVIAGMLITLFSGVFVTSGVSLPPLALAFLAGYSSDAFFQILEGVLRPRGAQPAGAQPAGAQPAGAQPAGAQPAGAQPTGAP